MSSFLSLTFIFFSQCHDISSHSNKITWILFLDCFCLLWSIPKNTRELGVGHRQFHADASMGLSYLSSMTSHFLNVLHWLVFNLFFIAWHWKRSEVWMRCLTKFQSIVECCQCIREHCQPIRKQLQHIGKRFQRVQKSVVTHFQCIFQCIFDVSLMPGFRK